MTRPAGNNTPACVEVDSRDIIRVESPLLMLFGRMLGEHLRELPSIPCVMVVWERNPPSPLATLGLPTLALDLTILACPEAELAAMARVAAEDLVAAWATTTTPRTP